MHMSKKVLIIGNGTSRLNHREFIQRWKDEIWACNSAYLEYYAGDIPRLDVLLADYHCLQDIVPYKQKHGGKYKLFGKNHKAKELPGVQLIDMERKFINDSGSTLVARALHKGYDEIYVVGFDLGGSDLYVKGHESRNKEKWIRNWRKIAGTWGLQKVHFIGYNHKDFILSNNDSTTYAELYMNGYNHIDYLEDQGLTSIVKETRVLILGNGKTRKNESIIKRIKEWEGEIWVCNEAYKEYKSFPRLDRVGTVHNDLAKEIVDFKEKKELDFDIYVRDIITDKDYKNKVKYFKDKRGWSTGNLMIIQAILDEYKEINLVGYDFGGPDVYQENDRPGKNFSKQFKAIRKEFGYFKGFKFWGSQPEFLV